MFDSHQKSTGTQYTMTVALLMGAFVFSPAVLIVSRPLGAGLIAMAMGCSAVCMGLAWATWRWNSRLTIPSLEGKRGG